MTENGLQKKVFIVLSVVFMTIGFILLSGKICFSQEKNLELNGKDYFEMRGFNVLVFENQYNGMFFDEKTNRRVKVLQLQLRLINRFLKSLRDGLDLI
ncbi:MAG: hypothetical protein A2V50_06225 [Bacteroidetes bacterium RBG_19FT_COMBO_42_10]|nr:MAG: hypothetical protein A2V50_06225 [Bacteroidetes bacterium RBG_19FT_COMBO_42_10]